MKKMRNRLVIIFTLIITIFAFILGIFFIELIEKIYIDALTNRLEKEANLIHMVLGTEEGRIQGNHAIDHLVNSMGEQLETRITIIDLQGKVLADSQYDKNLMENHGDRPEVKAAFSGKTGKEIRYSDTLGFDMQYLAIPMKQNDQMIEAVRVALSLEEIKTSLTSFWYRLIWGLFILFLITILISFRISNKITKPLEQMTVIAKKITRKDYSERFQINRNDEVGQLGKAMNIMAESLENQMQTIQENEKKLTTVLNNMSSGIILVDQKGTIILTNPALEYLIGEQAHQIIGKKHDDVGKETVISELIEKSLNTGQSFHTEIGIYQPTKKYLNTNIAPIIDDQHVIGVLVVLHDITRMKQLEKMRTEFVASVSHELRTPITAIKGFAETLMEGSVKEEETRQSFYTIIYKESDRLHRLINDLLDLSKIELNKDILKYSTTNLKALIESTINTMIPQAEKKKIIMKQELSSVIADVDEDRIKQVMINLLTNAIAYTPENGQIFIRLQALNQEQVKIEVEDTGIGIPEKNLPRIFERFYRVDKARSRESGGTGLGLAIVKHIVESHGGNIQVKSQVNAGTRFIIMLPKLKKNS